MPWRREDYPANWEQLRAAVRARAGDRCEGSALYPECRAANGRPHPATGSIVVCTVAHLFEDDLQTQDIGRLRFLCNRCHLALDRQKHMRNASATRRRKRERHQLALEGM